MIPRSRFAALGAAALLAAAGVWLWRSVPLAAEQPAPPESGDPVGARAPAAQPGAATALASTASTGPAALRSAIDAAVEEQMAKFNLPGAVVAVVHGGEVLHLRGYGYADVEAGTPFDAMTSVLRTASVSKLFTATAVLQLVEQGMLDLDADVNGYLDFRLPDTYPEPITLRHLLTHTAGFDERLIGSAASRARPEDRLTARQFLTSHDAAPRVRPPGQVISYSNYGMALAGYVVERVSGIPFARYVDERIHVPLGMTRSTFEEPLPADLATGRVQGHAFARGRHRVLPITFQSDAPAGSQFSTGADLARFMLAHLNGGELDGARILGSNALRQMHAQAFTHHAALPGWTLGFSEYRLRGQRMIGHGGDLPGYHNQLTLVPDEGLGVFVHFNGTWPITLDDDPRARIVEQVVGAFLPASGQREPDSARLAAHGGGLVSSVTAFATPDAPAQRVAGNYRFSRHPKTSIQKLLVPSSLFRLHVRERDDGTIRITMPLGFAAPTEWEPVAPLLYRKLGDDEFLAFGQDGSGRATHLFPTLLIPIAFERVRWYESEVVLLGTLGVSALGLVAAAVAWPAGSLVRRVRRREPRMRSAGQRRRRAMASAIGVLGTSVLATLGVMLVQANTAGHTPLLSLQPALAVATGVCGALALSLGYSTVRAWRDRDGALPSRIGHSAIALAAVVFVWQMHYWNVLQL